MYQVLLILFSSFIYTMIGTIITNAILLTVPKRYRNKKLILPMEYMIDKKNDIEYQNKYECSAYSSAYVLRHYGENIHAMELYERMPCKSKSGMVRVKGIIKLIRSLGYHITYYKGNIQSIKEEIATANPVIVFVRSSKDVKWLHYTTIVGYDKEGFYIAESLHGYANGKDEDNTYNRKVSYNDFKQMWKIKKLFMPFYSNTFLVIKK